MTPSETRRCSSPWESDPYGQPAGHAAGHSRAGLMAGLPPSGSRIPCMMPWAASRRDEVVSPSPTTRSCIGACSFCSPGLSSGAGWSPHAVRRASSGEVTALKSTPGFEAISMTWADPPPISRPVSCQKQMKSGLCKNRNIWHGPVPIWTPITPTTLRCCEAAGRFSVKRCLSAPVSTLTTCFKDQAMSFRRAGQVPRRRTAQVAPDAASTRCWTITKAKPHIDVFERFQEKYSGSIRSTPRSSI